MPRHASDEPSDELVELAPRPAPSPGEVARASASATGAWTAKQLAEWGVPYPRPNGWRAELTRLHVLGLDVTPLPYMGNKEWKATTPPPAAPTGQRWSPIVVSHTRAIGTPDPDDPLSWH